MLTRSLTVFILFCITYCNANIEYDGWLTIQLLHSFGSETTYTERGNVSIHSLRSGTYNIDQHPIQSHELKKLQELTKTGDFYKLKSIIPGPDGTEETYLSSIKAETLLENKLYDTITVWVLHNGDVAAVSLSPSLMDVSVRDSSMTKFSSDVFVRHVEHAPVPDTAGYIQKLEREREAREKGDFKDNRSFLAKYWMYILPVVIFVLISGASNPEQGAAR